MNRTEKLELLALLEEHEKRSRGNKIATYFPDTGPLRRELYTKHLQFFQSGATFRERCFMAGNRVGKCIAGDTLIESPYGDARKVSEIRGAHWVWAWDGEKRVPALAEEPFAKPSEMVYRVWLQSGHYVDCAAEHRFLSDTGWLFLSDLFAFVPCLPASSSDESLAYAGVASARRLSEQDHRTSSSGISPARSLEDVQYLMSKAQDSQGGYHQEYRSNGERPPFFQECVRSFVPSLADVLRRTLALLRLDDLAYKYRHILRRISCRLSILDVVRQIVGRFAEFLSQVPCIAGAQYPRLRQDDSPLAPVSASGFRSLLSSYSHQLKLAPALITPDGSTDSVLCYQPIGVQPIYDFHVPGFKNYCTAGFIHHNTETGGGYELTLHLTGRYPEWWNGRRFDQPIQAWTAGDTSKTVREIIQAKLLGKAGEHGSGLIPKDLLVRTTPKQGIPEAVDTIYVKHISGGLSHVALKSYDQRREAFQGTEQDVIWLDEEPPLDIYTECLMRTMTNNGLLMLTFTPLMGMSETVMAFLPNGEIMERQEGSKCVIMASWDDVPHLSEDAKRELLASIPPFQRDARSKGIPQLGSGAIYPVPESEIIVSDFEIPDHWLRGYGLDVGWNRTSAGFHAWDRQNDVVYRIGEHYRGQAEPSVHAEAIKARGAWIPGVCDPAARGRTQTDGQQLLQMYKDLGLDLETANNAVEAGIYEMWQRLSTGRYKVFKSCMNWLAEYRLYRRDEKGRVVKGFDHAMDESRYFIMSGLERSKTKPLKVPKQVVPYNIGTPVGWMG